MRLDARNFGKGNPELEAELKQEAIDRKVQTLDNCLEQLADIIISAKSADIELDFADMLSVAAKDLRANYSTVKFRHTGTVGEPGRARE